MEWNGKTQQQWYDYIDSRTVDNYTQKLLRRIVESPNYSFNGEPSYATLQMQNKPSRAQFEQELEAWRIEARAKVDAAFADLGKRDDFKARLQALNYPRLSISRVTGSPNGELELKKLLDVLDEALLQQIEAEDVQVTQDIQALEASQDKVKRAREKLSGHRALLESIAEPTPMQAALRDVLIVLEE